MGEQMQRPWQDQRDDGSPENWNPAEIVGRARDDDIDFARRSCLGGADRLADAGPFRRVERTRSHHQLPEAPPPPKDPPPPENPPPKPPPPEGHSEDLPPDGQAPPAGIAHGHPDRLRPRCRCNCCCCRDLDRRRKSRSQIARMMRTIVNEPSPSYGRTATPLCRPALEILRVAGENLHEVVDAALDAAGEIAGAKARQDGVVDDQARHRVGQRALEPVADLDPHLALVGRDDQQRAVVLALLADAPVRGRADSRSRRCHSLAANAGSTTTSWVPVFCSRSASFGVDARFARPGRGRRPDRRPGR